MANYQRATLPEERQQQSDKGRLSAVEICTLSLMDTEVLRRTERERGSERKAGSKEKRRDEPGLAYDM